jgi:hypothetical protein
MAIPFWPKESWNLSTVVCSRVSVEVVYTVDVIVHQISTIIDTLYWESIFPINSILNEWSDVRKVLKLALDSCVWKRDIRLEKNHSWPYSLEEIKIAIENISPKYFYNFWVEWYTDIKSLITDWVKSFPDPEVVAEDSFMNDLVNM